MNKSLYFVLISIGLSAFQAHAFEQEMTPGAMHDSIGQQALQKLSYLSAEDIALVRQMSPHDMQQLQAMRMQQGKKRSGAQGDAAAMQRKRADAEVKAYQAWQRDDLYKDLLKKAKRGLSLDTKTIAGLLGRATKGSMAQNQVGLVAHLIETASKASAWATKSARNPEKAAQEKLWQEWSQWQREYTGKMKPFSFGEKFPEYAIIGNDLILLGIVLDALQSCVQPGKPEQQF